MAAADDCGNTFSASCCVDFWVAAERNIAWERLRTCSGEVRAGWIGAERDMARREAARTETEDLLRAAGPEASNEPVMLAELRREEAVVESAVRGREINRTVTASLELKFRDIA